MNPKCALILGYGSIGRRHAKVLEGMGFTITVISRHHEDERVFSKLTERSS